MFEGRPTEAPGSAVILSSFTAHCLPRNQESFVKHFTSSGLPNGSAPRSRTLRSFLRGYADAWSCQPRVQTGCHFPSNSSLCRSCPSGNNLRNEPHFRAFFRCVNLADSHTRHAPKLQPKRGNFVGAVRLVIVGEAAALASMRAAIKNRRLAAVALQHCYEHERPA
jgi:hypothetical protein